PKSAKIYKTLWELGNGESPLLTHSNNLREKLDKSLDKSDVFLAMRYGNPSMDVVLEEIRSKNYERIIILPLYPQYASASSGSCIDKALKIIKRWWVIPEITVIGQFYTDPGFIDSFAKNAEKYDLNSYDHILFSYHGLPERQ